MNEDVPISASPSGRSQHPQVTGLNDNLDFLGVSLHIQTEKIEHPSPRIVTQVFSKGRIVFSKKSLYAQDALALENPEQLHAMMRKQHREVIEEITEKQARIQNNQKQ